MVINTNEVIRVKNNQLANGFSIYRVVASRIVFREYLRELGADLMLKSFLKLITIYYYETIYLGYTNKL